MMNSCLPDPVFRAHYPRGRVEVVSANYGLSCPEECSRTRVGWVAFQIAQPTL